jgi:hypothetical protein
LLSRRRQPAHSNTKQGQSKQMRDALGGAKKEAATKTYSN